MKNINKIVLLIIVSCLVVTDASSQSFWKKLEKGLENVGKEIDKLDKAVNSESEKKEENISEQNPEEEEISEATTETIVKPDNVIKGILQGKVKEIAETNTWNGKITKTNFQLNELGQITLADVTSYNGNVNLKVSYEYNPNGSISKRTIKQVTKSDNQNLLGAPNEIRGISICELPASETIVDLNISSGNMQADAYSYKNGKLERITTTTERGQTEQHFDAAGTVVKRIEKTGTDINEYTYNSKGELISQKQNGKTVPIEKDEFEDDYYETVSESRTKHDSQGRLISDFSDLMQITYTYNLNGFLSSIKQSDRWWGDATTLYTGYVYDAQKNWTKRTMKKTGDYYGKTGMTVTTTRIITYY